VYSNLRLSAPRISAGDTLTVSIEVRNTGDRTGDEVVQLYVRDVESTLSRPDKELKGFVRLRDLAPGESRARRARSARCG